MIVLLASLAAVPAELHVAPANEPRATPGASAPPAAVRTAATDRQTRVVPLSNGRRLALEITIGDVSIQAEDRADAVLDIVRTAPDAQGLARVPIEITEEPDEVRISALQLDEGTDPAYRTNVSLRVPRRAVLRPIRIMEGRLTLEDLAGEIEAAVQRGSIEADRVEGTIRLETEMGDVVVRNARLTPDGLLRLRTFNGDARLALAERPPHARVLALALNGTIASDIPLRTRDTWGPRFGEATIGRGEPVISIDVVTGGIEITAPIP